MKALFTLLVLMLSTLGVQSQRHHRPAKVDTSVSVVSNSTVYTWEVDRSDCTDKGVLVREVYVVTDRAYYTEVTLIPLDEVCVRSIMIGDASFTRLDSPTPLSVYKRKDGKSTYKGTTSYVVLFQPTSVSNEAIKNLLK